MRVVIQGQVREIKDLLGEGGEARVYRLQLGGIDYAAKIYKGPKDPDFAGNEQKDINNRKVAEQKLAYIQAKLASFPMGLPKQVVAPQQLIFDGKQNVLGYLMPAVPGPATLLRKFADKDYRATGIDTNDVITMLAKLRDLVNGIHDKQVVIGDFNDLNVLVNNNQPYMIDADSFQFGQFYCTSYTQRFGDPRLCNKTAHALQLARPHDTESDWYAFCIMLFQSLMYVTPFDGVYKSATNKVPHDARPLHGISVFAAGVKYPKFATPLDALPDDLMHVFDEIFTLWDRNKVKLPGQMLDNLRWTKCLTCGGEHARAVCPTCKGPGVATTVTEVTGKVKRTVILNDPQQTVLCVNTLGHLRYLAYTSNSYVRETGQTVFSGPLNPLARYRISGDTTLMALQNTIVALSYGARPHKQTVETFQGRLPVYDANDQNVFWIENGRLLMSSSDMSTVPLRIGDTLPGQTLLWTGAKFGFGFYRAAEMQEFFVFNDKGSSLRDGVKVPRLRGHLLDTTCVFSDTRCWFFATVQDGPQTINRCSVINSKGEVLMTETAELGHDGWLGSIRGKCAAGNSLYSSSDEGIERVDFTAHIVSVKRFPDTEPYVNAATQLYLGTSGLYAVDRHTIQLLQLL